MNQLLATFLCSIFFIGCWSDQKNNSVSDISETPEYTAYDSLTMKRDAQRSRYAWQKPDFVIEKLGDLDGKVVADIGAGTGYFTFRLFRKAEKVIATEVDTHLINVIELFKSNLDESEQGRIETRLDHHNKPNLNKNEVDYAMIINTVGYLADQAYYLTELHEALTEDGELMIVDFKLGEIPDDIAPPDEYRVDLLKLEHLLGQIGYQNIVIDYRSLQYQFIVKAKKH